MRTPLTALPLKSILGASLGLACAAVALADTVTLNSGETLEGRILVETAEKVVIKVDGANRALSRSTVKSITYSARSRSTVNRAPEPVTGAADISGPAERPQRMPAQFDWPPEVGKRFPDLRLRDANGIDFQFSTLAGKVVLVQWVAMGSPWSQGFTGSRVHGVFGPAKLPVAVTSLDEMLEQFARGVAPEDDRLAVVQILVFNPDNDLPTVDDAKAWVDHFGLAGRKNWKVLIADPWLRTPEVLGSTRGFLLLDATQQVVGDSTGYPPKHDLAWRFMPMLADLLGKR